MVIVGSIIGAAMFIEGITGFGAAAIAMPIISLFIDMRLAVMLLSTTSLIFAIYVLKNDRAKVNRAIYRSILLFAGMGFPIGLIAAELLPEKVMKIALGLFVLLCALQMLCGKSTVRTDTKTGLAGRAILFIGGIVHGAFSCGGPMIVLYASNKEMDRTTFRVTMSATWAVFNSILILKSLCFCSKELCRQYFIWLPVMILCMSAGAGIGNLMHRRIKENGFLILTKLLLLMSGIFMIAVQFNW